MQPGQTHDSTFTLRAMIAKSVRAVLIVCLALLLSFSVSTPAYADAQEGTATKYVADGWQHSGWFTFTFNNPKMRSEVQTDDLNNNRAVDIFFDWQIHQGKHYDSRVVRVFRQDAYRETDSGGNGWVQEINRGDRVMTGIGRGAACIYFDDRDSYTNPNEVLTCDDFSAAPSPVTESRSFFASPSVMYCEFWVRWNDGSVSHLTGGKSWAPDE